MGFIDTAPGTTLPVFYNVVHAVGANCPNMRDDVKLIQYMLIALYEKAVAEGMSKPAGELTVTGVCDSVTMNWILKFQMDAGKAHPGKIAIDNRMDRVRQKSFVGSISKTVYTLAALNASLLKLNTEAFVALPGIIPLENPSNVPPPSWDVVNQKPQIVPASGGM
jgi:hypothetical protein